MLTADQIITSLELGSNRILSEEDLHDIQQYHNGRALSQLVFMPGWSVLVDAFEEHKKNAVEELLKINPGDKDLVLAAHAVAFAVHKTLEDLLYEVNTAIENSKRIPDVMRERLSESETPTP